MSLRSQPGIRPRDLVLAQPLEKTPGERGEQYGKTWGPKGDPFEVFPLKLTSREKFQAGKEDTTIAYRLYCDLPVPVTEKGRIRLPDVGDLDVTSVVPYPTEGLAVIEAEVTV